MLKIGLTGGIGSGKSTISNILKEKKIPVIDADIIAREVLNLYSEVRRNISETFGKEFFDESGALKRRLLGSYIFQNEDKRKDLEAIIIPYIKKEIFKEFDKYNKKESPFVVLDAPTLIEQGIDKEMDINILVFAKRKVQIERVMLRDNLTEEEAINRMNSQMSLEEKKNFVNFVIDNSGALEETREQLESILNIIRSQ